MSPQQSPQLKTRPEAISLMNEYARRNEAFFFAVDFDAAHCVVQRMAEQPSAHILFDFNGTRNYRANGPLPPNILFAKKPVSFSRYRRAFENVQKHIYAGNTYLVNLTFPTFVETNLNLRQIFLSSRAKYKFYYDDQFVVFSPETFLQIRDGVVATFPMKGTIDAALPDAENRIMENEKEKAEHTTVVDLLRNDLSVVSRNVCVKRYRFIERVHTNGKNLLQVSSEIAGVLPADYGARIGEILFTLLPAGSISGAPKRKTMEIIRETECCRRGFYTGVCGYYADGSLDCGVMIRFIEKRPDGFYYRSGGGITAYSDLETEYRELIDKVYLPLVRNNKNSKQAAAQSRLSQSADECIEARTSGLHG
jgi:para-aminobenzoate synthetase component 1